MNAKEIYSQWTNANNLPDYLKDQLNVDLTGFAAKVPLGSVPKGNYRFGMLVEDRCSRQKLVGYSNWVLQAGDESGQVKEEKTTGKAGSDNGL